MGMRCVCYVEVLNSTFICFEIDRETPGVKPGKEKRVDTEGRPGKADLFLLDAPQEGKR